MAATCASYCQGCVKETHPKLMTTYCLRSLPCDRCGHRADLAIVRIDPDETKREDKDGHA